MKQHVRVLLSQFLYLISAILLLGSLNLEFDIDGLYLLGGSSTECSRGVFGVFKSAFLVLLSITDILLIIAAVGVLRSRSIRLLSIASVLTVGLFLLSGYWQQIRLFSGYDITATTNMLDAQTGKCYLFYGAHDGVLWLSSSLALLGIGYCYQRFKL